MPIPKSGKPANSISKPAAKTSIPATLKKISVDDPSSDAIPMWWFLWTKSFPWKSEIFLNGPLLEIHVTKHSDQQKLYVEKKSVVAVGDSKSSISEGKITNLMIRDYGIINIPGHHAETLRDVLWKTN